MNTILVATDFSAPANNAVEFAAHLARECSAELVLFHVFKPSAHVRNAHISSASLSNIKENDKSRLQEVANSLAGRFRIQVREEFTEGDVVSCLDECTKRQVVDLVVMGIESDLTEYKWLGNTTTASIKLIKFPLLVVPHEVQFHGFSKILFACEMSFVGAGRELGLLKLFAKKFSSHLEVFHVFKSEAVAEEKQALESAIDALLPETPHSYNYIENSEVVTGITKGVEQLTADLLVMIPHKLGFVESITKGSHKRNITVKTRVPLLVLG